MIPSKEIAFIVHKENEIIKFQCSPAGLLYQYEVSKDYYKKAMQVEQYTKRAQASDLLLVLL